MALKNMPSFLFEGLVRVGFPFAAAVYCMVCLISKYLVKVCVKKGSTLNPSDYINVDSPWEHRIGLDGYAFQQCLRERHASLLGLNQLEAIQGISLCVFCFKTIRPCMIYSLLLC